VIDGSWKNRGLSSATTLRILTKTGSHDSPKRIKRAYNTLYFAGKNVFVK
jgi:hypothetical protein